MSILSSLLLVKNQVFLCKWENYCVSYICYELVISLRTVTVSCFLSLLTRNKAIFEIKDVSLGKESAWQCRRHRGSIPESGRSPGVGNGSPLQYSCLKNPMDRGAWRATVHGVTKSRTWLSDFTSLHYCEGGSLCYPTVPESGWEKVSNVGLKQWKILLLKVLNMMVYSSCI